MDNKKRLSVSFTTMIVLCICLCVTSFALGRLSLGEVKENTFATGTIDINLNDGNAIITQDDYLFEPGMTVEKEFFIRNEGTWEVYYTLFFSGVEGELADVLDVTILDSDKQPLMTGKMSDLTRENIPALENELAVGETQTMYVRFYFPENAGNSAQTGSLKFELSAIAVQTKNNPEKEFD